MTKTIRLNDLQRFLLSAAAVRDSGSLLPIPDPVAGDTARIAAAVKSLLKRELVEERPVTDRALVYRSEDEQTFGLFVTEAGRQVIGISDTNGLEDEPGAAPEASPPPAAGQGQGATKASLVLGLLQREQGATLAELVAATGWLPHTARAHLTGLRKKGHAIAKAKRGDATCYRMTAAG